MTMRAFLIVSMAAMLAACQQQADTQPATPEEKADAYLSPEKGDAQDIVIFDAEEILGEWRVATIGGDELTQRYAIIVGISDDKIVAVSQCISFTFGYEITGGTFDAESSVYPTGAANPPPQCERSLSHDETAFRDAVLSATTAQRLANGALVFDGPQSSVTMFVKNDGQPDPTPQY